MATVLDKGFKLTCKMLCARVRSVDPSCHYYLLTFLTALIKTSRKVTYVPQFTPNYLQRSGLNSSVARGFNAVRVKEE